MHSIYLVNPACSSQSICNDAQRCAVVKLEARCLLACHLVRLTSNTLVAGPCNAPLLQRDKPRQQTRGYILDASLQQVLVGGRYKQSSGFRIDFAMRRLPQLGSHPQLPPLDLLDLHCRKQQPPRFSLHFLQA